MKILTLGAAIIGAALMISPLAAQDEHHDNAPAQEQQKAKPEKAKPETGRSHNAPRPDATPRQAPESPKSNHTTSPENKQQAEHQRAQRQSKQTQQQKQAQQKRQTQEKQAKNQQKQEQKQQQAQREQTRRAQAQNQGNERNSQLRAQNSRPEYANAQGGNRRIPEDRFRAHFGHEHRFRIGHPSFVEGRPRFQYSGYSFELLGPWPAAWSYDDDCYIDYVDGNYWLFDPLHPGFRVEVEVLP